MSNHSHDIQLTVITIISHSWSLAIFGLDKAGIIKSNKNKKLLAADMPHEICHNFNNIHDTDVSKLPKDTEYWTKSVALLETEL